MPEQSTAHLSPDPSASGPLEAPDVDRSTADPDAVGTNPGRTGTNPNREAAARRLQLREVEAERDGLREQVVAFQRAEVERIAATRLTDPADVWLGGVDLNALRAEDGNLDAALVSSAVDRVVSERPHWARPAPSFDAGYRGQPDDDTPSFGHALKGGAH